MMASAMSLRQWEQIIEPRSEDLTDHNTYRVQTRIVLLSFAQLLTAKVPHVHFSDFIIS